MAQQQYQVPQPTGRPFSPPQQSISPGTPQSFSLPPTKRQRISPDPRSQPNSPYIQSPYGMSPINAGPSSTTASPQFNSISLPTTSTPSVTPATTTPAPSSTQASRNFSHISVPPNPYTTPYANGNATPTLNPTSGPAHTQSQYATGNLPNMHQNPNGFSYQASGQHPNGVQQNMQINNSPFTPNYNMQSQPPGTMGPPSKPVERDNVNDDQTDVLANAGVDLRAEESYAMSFYTGSFNSQPSFSQATSISGGHAFSQFDTGDSTSFYGAGPANQPGQPTDKDSQDELQKKAADKAWADAAHNLARSREHELNNPHVEVSVLWRKMDKIARDNGLLLSTEPGGKMPTLKLPSEFRGEVITRTAVGPQGAITTTGGAFLPPDTALADQVALVSLATNQRVRILLEEAAAIARGRFVGSDGVIPPAWADVAEQTHGSAASLIIDGHADSAWENTAAPRSNSLYGSNISSVKLPTSMSDSHKNTTGAVNYKAELTKSLREVATADREAEEKRLSRRQNRSTDGTSRSASVTPGTPLNSAAPEPTGKPLTKKEREKQDKGKLIAVDNHVQANNTMNTFLGGGKKKKYSWMTGGGGGGGGSGTGPNPASRISPQLLPGMPGGGGPDRVRLTAEGMSKIGSIREAKYPLIELRDWVMALENDGKQLKSLQEAYTIYERK